MNSTSPAIDIQFVCENFGDGEFGPAYGFYAKGHHDAATFARACNGHDTLDRCEPVIPADVKQVWWRNVPVGHEGGGWVFHDAQPNSRGAYRATVAEPKRAAL